MLDLLLRLDAFYGNTELLALNAIGLNQCLEFVLEILRCFVDRRGDLRGRQTRANLADAINDKVPK